MKEKYTISLIGGTGKMGQCFKPLFEKLGHEVLVASNRTKLTPQECAQRGEIVILCVPIHKTPQVIQEIAPLVRQEAVLMDFTSLKQKETALMLRYASSEVIGAHPLFGPLRSVKGQVFILTPLRAKHWLPKVVRLFSALELRVKTITPKQHDQVMALVQSLTHFLLVSFASTLETLTKESSFNKRQVSPLNLKQLATPIYGLTLDLSGRILSQPPELYADLAMNNDHTTKALAAYLKEAQGWYRMIKEKKRSDYLNAFKQARRLLAGSQAAHQRIGKIIHFLSKEEAEGDDDP